MNGGLINVLFSYFAQRQARHKAVRAMRELDDHMLHDIGLDRWMIEAAVDGKLSGNQNVCKTVTESDVPSTAGCVRRRSAANLGRATSLAKHMRRVETTRDMARLRA